MISRRATGVLLGYLADLAFADPRRGHPVAGFGTVAARLEGLTYRDTRTAGGVHVGLLLIPLCLGAAAAGPSTLVLAGATYVSLGGTSLARTGLAIADALDRGDLPAAREILPSLCGRDPAYLDHDGLTRAALESIAENTSDAQVAPVFWATVAGTPGVLLYRAANTLDAMIGHRSPRYAQFGWAAARFDDVLNYAGARLAGVLVIACAPFVGGSAVGAWRAWRRDAAAHPSPNAGVVEAAFAGALGLRLGGPTQYRYELQIRPTLGDGVAPTVDDLRRAVRLSRMVQGAAIVVAGVVAGVVASVVERVVANVVERRFMPRISRKTVT